MKVHTDTIMYDIWVCIVLYTNYILSPVTSLIYTSTTSKLWLVSLQSRQKKHCKHRRIDRLPNSSLKERIDKHKAFII